MSKLMHVLSGAALAGLVFTGCGGDAKVVTVTQHTDTTSVTAPSPTTPTTATTTPTTSVTTPAADASAALELRLPAQDAIASLDSGTVQRMPTASSMVTALYAAGDSAIPGATTRLEGAGYSGGVLRDQRGSDPKTGLTLFRIYAYRVRDAATAEAEIATSVDEVKSTSSAPSEPVEVPEVPGGRGLLLKPKISGKTAQVLYVTWPAGQDVYGIQAFAGEGARLYQPEILELAQTLHRAWANVP